MKQKRDTDNNRKQFQKKNNSRDLEASATAPRQQRQQREQLQQQQQQLLRSSNGQVNDKNSKLMLAQVEEGENLSVCKDEEKNKRGDRMTFCFKGRWILLLSMIVSFIITATLVAMLTISLLDNEDQCFQLNYQFQQPSYNLFSTKTTYSTTIQYLNQSSSSSSSKSIYNTDRSSIELPNIFSKSDSLNSLHDRLTSAPYNCKVRQLHYIGRHAARFPKSKGIEEINKLITSVQARIDLSKDSPLNASNNNNNNNNNNNHHSNNGNNQSSNKSLCINHLAQYKQWTTFMVPEQGNLIMDSGSDETQAIAQRLKSIYPSMFNASEAKIEIGTTEELRTAQTAMVFLKQMENFALDFCSADQFPTENLSSPTRAEELDNNDCYRQFLKKFHKDKLQFHKRCESFHKEEYPLPYNLNFKEPNRTKFIAASVSKKLKLAKEDYLTTDEADAIYKVCKYETALSGSSVWCSLFSDNDLKFYEFLGDIDDFFNQAYGHPDQARSACPVTTDLIKAFKAAIKQQAYLSDSTQSKSSQPEAHFYFTHSEVIQKILAAIVDLEQDPEYSPKNVIAHLQAGTVPEARIWRTSLFTPFSANIAFTLYDCPLKAASRPDSASFDIDVTESHLKIVASLNERPILLDGCVNQVCDLNELLADGRMNREKRCKMEDICKKNIVVN